MITYRTVGSMIGAAVGFRIDCLILELEFCAKIDNISNVRELK